MNIYIIHYKELKERKNYLDNILSIFENNPIYIDEYDRDTLIIDDIKYNSILWNIRTDGLYNSKIEYRDLKKSEICNSLSHLKALKKISESDYKFDMILEDDVILPNDYLEKFVDLLSKIPNDADFVFFGSSYSIDILDQANLSKSLKINDNIYKKEPGKTRTVDAYLVSPKAAKKIVDEISEICLPFDFELNYFFKKLNMNVYWYEPGFVSQGSQTGQYKSSIR
ncbi:glycosyltransferase family 25 protein [Candidatus Dojkabacteria bacterium]|jgi:GR25 family glycosyltransferase involved in LPS biosynthesis|nr:glycosyltransferase family 25 protein [Candidatus Dojkabacteria bacterium]